MHSVTRSPRPSASLHAKRSATSSRRSRLPKMVPRRLRPRLPRVYSRTCVRFAAGGSRNWQPAVSIPIVRARWTSGLPPRRSRSSRAGLPPFARTDRSETGKRMETIVSIEDLATSLGGPAAPPPSRRERRPLVSRRCWKLAANTIGGRPRTTAGGEPRPGSASAQQACRASANPRSRAARADRFQRAAGALLKGLGLDRLEGQEGQDGSFNWRW